MLASLFSPTDTSYASLILRFRRKKQTDKRKQNSKRIEVQFPLFINMAKVNIIIP